MSLLPQPVEWHFFLPCGMKKIALGRAGEQAALNYLQELGMTLIARNWRSEHYELDLVMDAGDSIRIVEVKSLNESDGFDPLENMTEAKCGKQRQTIAHCIGRVKYRLLVLLHILVVGQRHPLLRRQHPHHLHPFRIFPDQKVKIFQNPPQA